MTSLKATLPFAYSVCCSCPQRLAPITHRTFTTSASQRAGFDIADLVAPAERTQKTVNKRQPFSNRISDATSRAAAPPFPSLTAALDIDQATALRNFEEARNLGTEDERPHRLHVLATKHNTHLTFVQPPRPASQTASSGISSTNASAADQKKIVDVLLSLSAGNIGFRKAGRGSYDAAYQLTAFALKQIQEKGMLRDIKKLEVVLRGFGAGREAVTKVLLGSEGRVVRERISAVKDATRLKIGGVRRKRPRR
jgi:small subunit ribosomal protein S11